MKDNKDEEKTLFQAIDAVDDKFLMETLKDMEKRKNQNHKQQLKFKQMTPMVKAATIALICFSDLRNKCQRGSSDIENISAVDSKDIYVTDDI